MKYQQRKKALVLLADGTIFYGKSVGIEGTVTGEICFNTGMTGYQEIFTDPSYFGQIMVTTNAHIGNYGVNTSEVESDGIKISGLIVRNFSFEHARVDSSGNLKDFLQEISLYTDLDDWDDKKNSVTLMTIHAAKGLEFSTVFVSGLEQGLFPLIRMDDDSDQLEEERRLFYVAVTRAMERVYLLNAKYRRKFGALNTSSFIQSEFLNEINQDIIKVKPYKTVYTKRVVRSGGKKTIQISRTVTEFDDFKVGDQVQHNLFGVGTILVLNGTGENQKVGVEFDGGLRKKLIVKYARLKKID